MRNKEKAKTRERDFKDKTRQETPKQKDWQNKPFNLIFWCSFHATKAKSKAKKQRDKIKEAKKKENKEGRKEGRKNKIERERGREKEREWQGEVIKARQKQRETLTNQQNTTSGGNRFIWKQKRQKQLNKPNPKSKEGLGRPSEVALSATSPDPQAL